MHLRPGGIGLAPLAWANVIVHVAGLALAAVAIGPGTPLAPLADRVAYLSRAPALWTLSWVCWIGCAALLLLFLNAVARQLGDQAELAKLGVVVACVGAAFDLFCDSTYIVVFPLVTALDPFPETLFLILERLTGIGSLIVANGAYSVAILLVTLALKSSHHVSAAGVNLGFAVVAAGLLLAGAGYSGVPWHAKWATPPCIGLFCLWVVVVSRSFPLVDRSS